MVAQAFQPSEGWGQRLTHPPVRTTSDVNQHGDHGTSGSRRSWFHGSPIERGGDKFIFQKGDHVCESVKLRITREAQEGERLLISATTRHAPKTPSQCHYRTHAYIRNVVEHSSATHTHRHTLRIRDTTQPQGYSTPGEEPAGHQLPTTLPVSTC